MAKKSGAAADCSGGTFVKLSWRSISADALAETDASGSTTNSAYNEYVFFAGRRIVSRNGTGPIFYYFADEVGTARTITTGNGPGQTPGQLCYDADFTPYGQEMQQPNACKPRRARQTTASSPMNMTPKPDSATLSPVTTLRA